MKVFNLLVVLQNFFQLSQLRYYLHMPLDKYEISILQMSLYEKFQLIGLRIDSRAALAVTIIYRQRCFGVLYRRPIL